MNVCKKNDILHILTGSFFYFSSHNTKRIASIYVFFIFVAVKMPILYIVCILSLCLNVLLLILFVHSRHAYRKLMTKSLDDQSNDVLASTVEESLSSGYTVDPDILIMNSIRQCFEKEKLFLNPELTMLDVAQHIGTSKHRLSTAVRKITNQNFASMLNHYRVQEAMDLLGREDLFFEKIEVIGEMCGFNSRQAFHAAFKKELGITPKHFRKINKIYLRNAPAIDAGEIDDEI